MPNLLTFTTPITVPNIRVVRILKGPDLNEDDLEMTFELLLASATGVIFEPLPRVLTIRNGNGCGGIAANPNPASTLDAVIDIFLRGAGVANAYTAVRDAMTGPDRRGQALNAMKAISGIVLGGPLNGTTQPILPPGTVT